MYEADQLRESQYTASLWTIKELYTTTASEMLQVLGSTWLIGEQEHYKQPFNDTHESSAD